IEVGCGIFTNVRAPIITMFVRIVQMAVSGSIRNRDRLVIVRRNDDSVPAGSRRYQRRLVGSTTIKGPGGTFSEVYSSTALSNEPSDDFETGAISYHKVFEGHRKP